MSTFQQALSDLGWSRTMTAGQRVHAGLAVLTAVLPELRAIRRGYAEQISAAQREVNADPGLNATGREARLTELTEQIRAEWLPRLEAVQSGTTRAAEVVEKAVAERWPTPATGVEAMLGRQAAWARARSLLELSNRSGTDLLGGQSANLSIPALLRETTDVETLHALREELPTWARTRGLQADTAATITDAVDLRLAEVASNSTIDLTARLRARAEVAGITPMVQQTQAELQGIRRDGLAAAMASRVNRQQVLQPLAHLDSATDARNSNPITASSGDAA